MKKKASNVETVIYNRFCDISPDLARSCQEVGEPMRIHQDDLFDFLYDDLREFYGSYEEVDENEAQVKAIIKKRLNPDRRGWIHL